MSECVYRARANEGVVNKASAHPFNNPIHGSAAKAQAENTTKVCPQGKRTVKRPNRRVDLLLFLRINVEIERLRAFIGPESHLKLRAGQPHRVLKPTPKMIPPKRKLAP